MKLSAANGSRGSPMTNYLEQRKLRLAESTRSELKLWGATLGMIITLASCFNYFLVPSDSPLIDQSWHILIWVGLAVFALAFVKPSSLNIIQRPLKTVGHFIGNLLLQIILTILYFVIVTPLGAIMRIFRKELSTGNWENKKIHSALQKRVSLWAYPFYIIYFLIENKAFIIIPLVISLLFIAMTVFFLQTPVVAPFVYTVF